MCVYREAPMAEKDGFTAKLSKALHTHGIDEAIIQDVLSAPYPGNKDICQDTANYLHAVMTKCGEQVDEGTLTMVMAELSCSRTGEMLKKSREFAKEHADKPFAERITLLAHVSQPRMIDENHISAYITGEHETVCSCWRMKGRKPEQGAMPKSYCFCCAGFMKFHYEKALGIELRTVEIPSSLLSGDKRCSVVFEILSK